MEGGDWRRGPGNHAAFASALVVVQPRWDPSAHERRQSRIPVGRDDGQADLHIAGRVGYVGCAAAIQPRWEEGGNTQREILSNPRRANRKEAGGQLEGCIW